jgi:energy-coupling factor transporter ATP-binding protein EcfA2
MIPPLLRVDRLEKRYTRGWPARRTTFSMEADFEIGGPTVVGVMGANGAGKTTLFELITGSNLPSAGRVLVAGQDIHQVRYRERGRLALHYHQSYQVRSFKRTKPAFMLEHAASERARVHLFDEPQFNTQDGYIGFMLEFFRTLRRDGKLVFLCLHPNEPVHLDILADVCERFVFVHKEEGTSRLMQAESLAHLAADERVRRYLGKLAPQAAGLAREGAGQASR